MLTYLRSTCGWAGSMLRFLTRFRLVYEPNPLFVDNLLEPVESLLFCPISALEFCAGCSFTASKLRSLLGFRLELEQKCYAYLNFQQALRIRSIKWGSSHACIGKNRIDQLQQSGLLFVTTEAPGEYIVIGKADDLFSVIHGITNYPRNPFDL